ncbi:SDR family NAD(P)-dependent oxidoreductase [Streptomyces sp. HNM0663]|uniref:SDR family NAD(P)-dependent oxidoreductase n=1 Tax=Streptomyces chengmaiensis TaxID=3040919 RepID=A0ABT6HRU2_9ACTN|nr:SDR family NAD(P)-dependent oxidoreductase [Streptomyces chengmaiensis]MDH2391447.1 SDR family NAD(P)-dependent oxidoreductase [Streptomyces chengmaiensis]
MSRVQGARVVVTGAGGGIGAALARRFAAEGAHVVVNDLDPERVKAVADETGALAVPGDASHIVEEAREALGGTVDVYCANAGLSSAGDAFAGEDTWAAAWDVNVMAHVRAARTLLPDWLERGGGRFVSTVSAAGLLTMVGAAPYSVSKHGAYAFAEWLSLTYRHRGIKVHAICPQGVRTDMLTAAGSAGELVLAPTAIEPEDVADALFEGIEADRFLILPHPEVAGYYENRATDPDRWLTAMNQIQQKWEETLTDGKIPGREPGFRR